MHVRFQIRHAAALISAGLIGLILTACDALGPAAGASKVDPDAATLIPERPDSRPAEIAEANVPTMDSIGPDSAMRIYYQFVDDRGGVQFVERLDAFPEAWRSRVGYVEMDRPPPLTPAAARESWKVSESRASEIFLANNTPTRGKRRMDDFQSGGDVVLYSATWCGYCTKARAHLERAGIEYEIRDVDNGGVARELKEKTGRGGVPVLDFDGEILRGYSRQQYDIIVQAIKG